MITYLRTKKETQGVRLNYWHPMAYDESCVFLISKCHWQTHTLAHSDTYPQICRKDHETLNLTS